MQTLNSEMHKEINWYCSVSFVLLDTVVFILFLLIFLTDTQNYILLGRLLSSWCFDMNWRSYFQKRQMSVTVSVSDKEYQLGKYVVSLLPEA